MDYSTFCMDVKTVGELREAIKNLPSDMKLDFSAGSYKDADHYCSVEIRRDDEIGKGVSVVLEVTEEHTTKYVDQNGKMKRRELCENLLLIRNSDWGRFSPE